MISLQKLYVVFLEARLGGKKLGNVFASFADHVAQLLLRICER